MSEEFVVRSLPVWVATVNVRVDYPPAKSFSDRTGPKFEVKRFYLAARDFDEAREMLPAAIADYYQHGRAKLHEVNTIMRYFIGDTQQNVRWREPSP